MTEPRNSERAAVIAWLLDLARNAGRGTAVGDALHMAADDVRKGKHRPRGEDLPVPPVVQRPRQISTIPAEERGSAMARMERIEARNRAAGTEPTKVPKGAQRT